MARYRFSPFAVEEQCMHAKRAHYHDSGCDGPALVFIVDGKKAGLRSNGIPRFIDEDPVTFDIVFALAKQPVEVTKNIMINIGLEAFTLLFGHDLIDIFIDVDNDGTLTTVGATVPKAALGCVSDSDMAPG